MNFEESKLNDEHVNQYTPKINAHRKSMVC